MRKLTKAELVARGFSEKSERFLADDGSVISKRQYQKLQRGGLTYGRWRKAVAAGEVQPKRELRPRASRVKARYVERERVASYARRVYYDELTWSQLKRVLSKSPPPTTLGVTISAEVNNTMVDGNNFYRNIDTTTVDDEGMEKVRPQSKVWVTIIPQTHPDIVNTDYVKRRMAYYHTPVTRSRYFVAYHLEARKK